MFLKIIFCHNCQEELHAFCSFILDAKQLNRRSGLPCKSESEERISELQVLPIYIDNRKSDLMDEQVEDPTKHLSSDKLLFLNSPECENNWIKNIMVFVISNFVPLSLL